MHTSSTLILVVAVFAASLVEMVEALTIVVAAGVSRGWRPALEGAVAALVVLGVLVLVVGVPLIRYIPLDALRVVVGALLLVLGLSWLRKAILRASGHKDPHDEDKIYAATVAELSSERRGGGGVPAAAGTRKHDGVGFAVAFKGVFLEGTEVVLIVISLGAAQHRLGLAALAAAAAAVLVAVVGLVVARQLSEVPENTIKTLVGVMLTSFGVFWVGEGAGVHWPGDDLAIPVLVGFFAVVFFAFTAFMRTQLPRRPSAEKRGTVTLRPSDRRRDAVRSGPSATSGGTSSSATHPSWRWRPGSSSRWPSCSRGPDSSGLSCCRWWLRRSSWSARFAGGGGLPATEGGRTDAPTASWWAWKGHLDASLDLLASSGSVCPPRAVA